MAIGKRIKNLRISKGIRQEVMARDLNVGQSTVSHWEANVQEPNPKQRVKLCKYFSITEADLFLSTKESEQLRKCGFKTIWQLLDSVAHATG